MQSEKVDILTDLVHYHENVVTYAQAIKKIHRAFAQGAVPFAWRNFYDFYHTDIIQHFEFEEKVVFPAIVAGKGSVGVRELIGRLEYEHIEIKRDGAELLTLYKANKESVVEKDVPIIEQLLVKFGNDNTRHAVLENEKLLPIIENNKRIRFLMGRAFLDYRNRYRKRYSVLGTG